ncbi:MAG: DUF1684 domain-containing protein [Saprospiraceae bacterium]
MENHSFSRLLPLLFWALLGTSACKTQASFPPDYEATHREWQQERLANLTAPHGWFSLVGLHWLKPGTNTCGSGTDQDILLAPEVPAHACTYYWNEGRVSADVNTSAGVQLMDAAEQRMAYRSVQWHLIERGGKWGVRVQDTLMPSRIRLRAIDTYPLNPSFRITAHWLPATATDSVKMRNVLDMAYNVPVEGRIRFRFEGSEYELTALDGGPDDLFLIFSDETTGDTSYGGGRYLYCPRADKDGTIVVDFNRAINPPCAFTPFATCLLPTTDNHLPLHILAGEKVYGEQH